MKVDFLSYLKGTKTSSCAAFYRTSADSVSRQSRSGFVRQYKREEPAIFCLNKMTSSFPLDMSKKPNTEEKKT
jgi:hypothetical protein